MLKKALFAVVVFCGAAIVLDLTAAYIYRRIAGHPWGMPQEQIERLYRIRVPGYHHDLAPMKSVVARWGPLTARVNTDSLGFRDFSCRRVPLSNSLHRVLLIGDSFTEGVGMEYPATFAGRITKSLGQDGVEVLNAAVASYSPIIYWIKIKYLIEIVGLCINEVVVFLDISDANDCADEFWLDSQRGVVSVGDAETNSMPMEDGGVSRSTGWLERNTILLQRMFVGTRLDSAKATVNPVNEWRGRWTMDPYIYTNYGAKGLARMDLYLSQLESFLRARNISLTLIVYPWPMQVVEGDIDSVQIRYWRDWCARKGVQFLNLFPCFVQGNSRGARQNMVDTYYVRGDVHWNEKGHERVAEAFLGSWRSGPNRSKSSSPCSGAAIAETAPRSFVSVNTPSDFDAQYHVAQAFYAIGFRDDAVYHYRKALEIDTNSVLALNNLAWVLATSAPSPDQDRQEPARLAERAVALADDGNPALLDTLAAAYAFAGRTNDAAIAARNARDTAAKIEGDQPNPISLPK